MTSHQRRPAADSPEVQAKHPFLEQVPQKSLIVIA